MEPVMERTDWVATDQLPDTVQAMLGQIKTLITTTMQSVVQGFPEGAVKNILSNEATNFEEFGEAILAPGGGVKIDLLHFYGRCYNYSDSDEPDAELYWKLKNEMFTKTYKLVKGKSLPKGITLEIVDVDYGNYAFIVIIQDPAIVSMVQELILGKTNALKAKVLALKQQLQGTCKEIYETSVQFFEGVSYHKYLVFDSGYSRLFDLKRYEGGGSHVSWSVVKLHFTADAYTPNGYSLLPNFELVWKEFKRKVTDLNKLLRQRYGEELKPFYFEGSWGGVTVSGRVYEIVKESHTLDQTAFFRFLERSELPYKEIDDPEALYEFFWRKKKKREFDDAKIEASMKAAKETLKQLEKDLVAQFKTSLKDFASKFKGMKPGYEAKLITIFEKDFHIMEPTTKLSQEWCIESTLQRGTVGDLISHLTTELDDDEDVYMDLVIDVYEKIFDKLSYEKKKTISVAYTGTKLDTTNHIYWSLFIDEGAGLYGEYDSDSDYFTKIPETPVTEAKESDKEDYNVDMTEAQAKKTLGTLTSQLQERLATKGEKMTQYSANIYANIITKNLLPRWSRNFKRLTITLDSYQSFNTMEFITPPITQEFVANFVAGRETVNKLLRKNDTIRLKMSPRIFHDIQNRDDAYSFFKAAVRYYDTQADQHSNRLMAEVLKLGNNMKHLIATTKLSGLVSYPLTLIFSFGDVSLSDKDVFKLNKDDVQAISKFVRNIATHYAAPEKEKKQIIADVRQLVQDLRNELKKESGEVSQALRDLTYLPEAVEKLYFGGFNDEILKASTKFIEANIDHTPPTPDLKIIYEKWGVKKLKRIPRDIVAYISIETEAIRDANDKMMISSYCLGKLEIVEWYIELIDTQSKKYVVPHSRSYLEGIRTQLLACFKKIMDTKITPPGERPIIDIKYPKGYEG